MIPPVTQQPIIHVDATPNEDYPLRILRAHRENCNCMFEANEPNPLVELMNEHNRKRAVILDRAIETLSTANDPRSTIERDNATTVAPKDTAEWPW